MQSKEKYFVLPNQSLKDIPMDVENIYFYRYGNGEESLTKLEFSSYGFTQLRSITVYNNCFKNVREFVLDGLDKLESVKIGEKCFSISTKERDDGVCRITNCSKLTQLEIGKYSYLDFNQFELLNLKSLKSITFGDICLVRAKSCILKGG